MKRNRSGILAGVLIAVALGASIAGLRLYRAPSPDAGIVRQSARAGCAAAHGAFSAHRSRMWLSLSARVIRVLADNNGRLTHQRFIVQCRDGQTVLVVNDVSIGQRVPVATGDQVAVRGIYVWNNLGGLVHFTHHATGGGDGGWILLRGRLYAAAMTGTRSRTDQRLVNAPRA